MLECNNCGMMNLLLLDILGDTIEVECLNCGAVFELEYDVSLVEALLEEYEDDGLENYKVKKEQKRKVK